MTGTASTSTSRPGVSRAAAWLRTGRGGLFLLALLIGAGSGLGAVAFRYLISFFTWLATGHAEFGQAGRVPSGHLPWLGPAFFVLIPAVGGLVYGPPTPCTTPSSDSSSTAGPPRCVSPAATWTRQPESQPTRP